MNGIKINIFSSGFVAMIFFWVAALACLGLWQGRLVCVVIVSQKLLSLSLYLQHLGHIWRKNAWQVAEKCHVRECGHPKIQQNMDSRFRGNDNL
ncbi:MAG: hypothetical protein ACREOI_25505 [bacterium]